MTGMKNLLASRKFWTAVMAVGVLVLVNVFDWNAETAGALAENVVNVAMILIGAIAVEDAAGKLRGEGGGQW